MKITALLLLAFIAGCSADIQKDIKQEKQENLIKKSYEEYQLVLLDIHNKERQKHSISNLELNEDLCRYAQEHAKEMATKGKIYHSNISNLKKFGSTVFGENVACGQKTEKSVVDAWLWSPMHRWNIMGKSYKKVGFGLASGNEGENYWCVVFTN